MALTRRQLLAGMAAGAAVRPPAAAARPQAPARRGGAIRPRIAPAVCLYSRVLIQIGYIDLPMIVRGLGFDGVDLSVERDGHVPPDKADYNLMPALEAFTGIGLDVPMLTTGLTQVDNDAEQVLGLATYIGVPFFRPGHWKFPGSSMKVPLELPLVQRDIMSLAQLGRFTKMAMGIHNYLDGAGGAAVADIDRVIRPIDPQWVGYDFDVGYATIEGGEAGFAAPFALALPRLKMVTVRDFEWNRTDGGTPQPKACPLGEGVVDFAKFFAALARARFAGPISVQVDHQPKDTMAAIGRDLAFVRKQIAAAYGGA
jgi:sugar phosphate isomerase/epimerase